MKSNKYLTAQELKTNMHNLHRANSYLLRIPALLQQYVGCREKKGP